MPHELPQNTDHDGENRVANLPYVSRETFLALKNFVSLLQKWNKAITLIGKNEDDIWNRHIRDSVQLFPLLAPHYTTISDFGSGGGLPGIVLSLLGVPEIHLIESDQRKAAFLQEASSLSAGKIVIHNQRIESITPWKSDIITARALAPLPKLLELVAPFTGATTQLLFLKGNKYSDELDEASQKWQFTSTIHPSITSSDSCILELNRLSPRGSHD